MTDEFQYWAFISYSHADAAWAKWLHRGLEGYRIPARLVGRESGFGPIPKKLFPVFRDRDELAGSAELGPELQKALKRSRFQIVIASKNSARSRWVNEEIKYFKSLGRASRVLALIVDGEPNATDKGQADAECFPQALRFQVDAAGTVSDQPAELIAADARKAGDGKANALLKLIAGVLGVGFNELRQRELQARNRRLAIIASLATGIAAVTIVLAVVAVQARNDALRRQQQAEDLLQFMLGDLRDKLEPIGKLSILDAVGKKAMDYFATLDQSDLTDTALGSRSRALHQLGNVRIKQGDMAGASEAFREAMKLDEELVSRHPDDPTYIRNVAQSTSDMGLAHYVKGEIEQARPWLERYAETANRLVMLEPGDTGSAQMSVEANMNLGAVAYAARDLAAAEAAFTMAVTRQQGLLLKSPQDKKALEMASDLHGWLCTVEGQRRAWPQALEQARRQVELQQQLVDLAPEDANYRFGLATARVRVLRTQAQIDPLEPDSAVLRETLRLTQELVELDPDNIEFAGVRVVTLSLLMEANLAADKVHAAEGAARERLELSRRIYRRAQDNAQVVRWLLQALLHEAKLDLLLKDRADARTRLQEAQALPLPPQPDPELASARLEADLLGWWAAASKEDAREAQARVEESLKSLEQAGAQAKPELMLRYAALRGDYPGAGKWYGELTEGERQHAFVRQFCRDTGACGAPAVSAPSRTSAG